MIIALILVTALILLAIKLYETNKNRVLNERIEIVQAQQETDTQGVMSETIPTVDDIQQVQPEVIPPPQPEVPREYPLPNDSEAKAYIYTKESRNCPTRWQGDYGPCPAYHGTPTDPNVGYGLCQSTPAWKMASAGEDWATSYETQDRWCTNYANSRYGGWVNAYNEWIRKKWW